MVGKFQNSDQLCHHSQSADYKWYIDYGTNVINTNILGSIYEIPSDNVGNFQYVINLKVRVVLL